VHDLATEEQLAKTLIALCEELKRDPHVSGLMVTGSVGRGDARAGSDLDLHVLLLDGHARPFSAGKRGRVWVEQAFADRAAEAERLAHNPSEIYAYLDGRILFDREGGLAELDRTARAAFDAYVCPPDEKARIGYWLASIRAKLAAAEVAGDLLRAGYYAATSSWQIIEGLWAAGGRPVPPGGAVWTHIGDLRDSPADLTSRLRALFGGSTAERVEAAKALVDWLRPRLGLTLDGP
jgi:hypothetical protein